MKITIIGAGGNIGQRITKEAYARNHELHLITSKPKEFFGLKNAIISTGDIFDADAMAGLIKGSDVVISTYAPPYEKEKVDLLLKATKQLIKASKKANIRLIAVGGAGSLKVDESTQLVDTPDFPEMYKAVAEAHREALETIYYKEEELDWTNVSPSPLIFEGERTGEFRIGEDELLVDDKGKSTISMEDFAIGIINEVEEKKYIKKRFTIGY